MCRAFLFVVQTEEGKAVLTGAGVNYTYYLGDNLGNTRVTFETKTASAVTIQKDDYYPFGMEINSQYLYHQLPKMNIFTIKKSYRRKLRNTTTGQGSMIR